MRTEDVMKKYLNKYLFILVVVILGVFASAGYGYVLGFKMAKKECAQ